MANKYMIYSVRNNLCSLFVFECRVCVSPSVFCLCLSVMWPTVSCVQRQYGQQATVAPQQGYTTQTVTRQYGTGSQVDGGTLPQQGYNRTLTRQNSAPLIDTRPMPLQVTN